MKAKKVVVFMISTGFISAAHAQSSVTLYGIIDSGIAYYHNASSPAGNQSTLVKFSSNLSGPRWGLKGTEDLGGGLAAVFRIENGFNIGTGALNQGGREFGRQSFVGLSSQSYGTVTVGRQYDPLVELVQPLTEDGLFGSTFATPGDIDNYDNSLRVNNSVKYTSPVLRGFQLETLYAFGGVAGSTGNGQTYSAAASYTNGPMGLAAGYFFANGGTTTTAGARVWTSSSDSLFNSGINSAFASAKSIQIARVAGEYAIGSTTFGAAFSNTVYGRDALSSFRESAKFNSASVFANYQVNPAFRVGAGYNYTKSSGSGSAEYNQFNLGADYALSKRTDVYAVAGWQKASGNELSAGGTTIPAVASIGSFGVNSGTDTQGLVIVGLRQKF
ncbi:porin [Caballeronia sp. SEWSISQ10-4 2]|uniref:porin n=1 Tax=Caballeronia sp. SEWSISQ10-4 2 TaxID=2937438 RepID=UPI002651493E|nr:porin [Caballeronia sp. SEWSISQ10-4 2]MDN7184674.1 porin [Caballeronia sp. SEWSISQ10-4 2]